MTTTTDTTRAPRRWMKQTETCAFFGLSAAYLLTLEAEGLLKPKRDGHRPGCVCRYWPQDVLDALAKRERRNGARKAAR